MFQILTIMNSSSKKTLKNFFQALLDKIQRGQFYTVEFEVFPRGGACL